MPTDNYLKVHRPAVPSIEFFFDSKVPVSVANARLAAHEFSRVLMREAQAAHDVTAAELKKTPDAVAQTAIAVWTHGVRGLGDLHCIGGCELCAPRPDLEIVEADEDEPAGVSP